MALALIAALESVPLLLFALPAIWLTWALCLGNLPDANMAVWPGANMAGEGRGRGAVRAGARRAAPYAQVALLLVVLKSVLGVEMVALLASVTGALLTLREWYLGLTRAVKALSSGAGPGGVGFEGVTTVSGYTRLRSVLAGGGPSGALIAGTGLRRGDGNVGFEFRRAPKGPRRAGPPLGDRTYRLPAPFPANQFPSLRLFPKLEGDAAKVRASTGVHCARNAGHDGPGQAPQLHRRIFTGFDLTPQSDFPTLR